MVKDMMGTIRRNIKTIKELSNEVVTSVANDETADKKSKELQDLIAKSNETVLAVRTKLEDMKKGNQDFQASKDATPAEVRIRMNMHNTLITKFVDLCKAYNEVQTEYQENTKEKLTRQCKIVKPEMPENEIQGPHRQR